MFSPNQIFPIPSTYWNHIGRAQQIACLMLNGSGWARKTSDVCPFLGVHILSFDKEKTLDLQIFIQTGKIHSCCEFQILLWTLLHLWYFDNVYISDDVKTDLFTHSEICNNLSALEKVRGSSRALQTSTMELFAKTTTLI